MSVRSISERKHIIDYYPGGRKGKRERLVFIGTEAEAMAEEQKLRRDTTVACKTNPPIRQIYPHFLAWYKTEKKPTTIDDCNFAFKHMRPFFDHLPISRLSPVLIDKYKEARLVAGVKKRTVNKELSYLQSLINYAAERGFCVKLSWRIPVFPKKDTKAPIPIVPTPEEIQRVLDCYQEERRGLFLLLYDQGLRKHEACKVKVEDIDLGSGMIRIIGKGGKEEIIPLTTERLKAELAARIKKVESGFLYVNKRTGKPFKDLRVGLENAAKRAGVGKHVYPHLLRHSFGTHAMSSGVSQKAIQGILRHTDLKTTDIYTHIVGDYLKNESAKFAGTIDVGKEKGPLEADLLSLVLGELVQEDPARFAELLARARGKMTTPGSKK